MSKSIMTLGPEGSYSSQATENIFPGCRTDFGIDNEKVIQQVSNHLACVSPIYNKYGTIVVKQLEAIYQQWMKNPDTFKVIGTHSLKINHVLAGLKGGVDIDNLTDIFSHPQALLQCSQKLNKLSANPVAANSTVSEIDKITSEQAVICSHEAAKKNRLTILDNSFAPKDNKTEFAIITTTQDLHSDECKKLNGEMKVAILSITNNSGGLANSLGTMAEGGINLKSIHSHPNGQGGVDFPLLVESLKGIELDYLDKNLKKQKAQLRIL